MSRYKNIESVIKNIELETGFLVKIPKKRLTKIIEKKMNERIKNEQKLILEREKKIKCEKELIYIIEDQFINGFNPINCAPDEYSFIVFYLMRINQLYHYMKNLERYAKQMHNRYISRREVWDAPELINEAYDINNDLEYLKKDIKRREKEQEPFAWIFISFIGSNNITKINTYLVLPSFRYQ